MGRRNATVLLKVINSVVFNDPFLHILMLSGPSMPCLLFVAGGSSGNSDVELVDLCDDGQTVCPKPANLPRAISQGSALRTTEGNPLLCGFDSNEKRCLEYVKESDSWVYGATMSGSRVDTTAVEFPNGTFWIMGSYTGVDTFTTELAFGQQCI